MQTLEMNGQVAKELLYEKKEITCTKTEYHRDVRDSIIDFKNRSADLGNKETADFCQSQLDKLDKEYGLPPHGRD